MNKKQGVGIDPVSIGMPVYNAASCIRESLESLLGQSYKNFELIISDNASTDDTEKICKEYTKRDKRIRYIRQKENIGACENFNFVLRQSNDKYFMWASDDDLWDKDFIKNIIDEYKKTTGSENVGLISARWAFADSKNGLRDLEKIASEKYRVSFLSFGEFLKDACFQSPCIYGIFRTEILKKVGGFQKSFTPFSDLLLIAKFLCISRVKIIDRVLFLKRKEPLPVTVILNGRENLIKKFFRATISLLQLSPYLIKNSFSLNLKYFLKKMKIYYDFNHDLIKRYYCNYRGEKLKLNIINLFSSFKLLMFLLSYDLGNLKRMENYQ